MVGQLVGDRVIQRGDAIVVETGGDGAEHRHGLRGIAERLAVPLHLLAHVAQRVLGASAIELVDRHEVGEIEHVDLLELARRAEFRCHHVERDVGMRHDRRVALADAGGLDDHELVAGRLARRDGVCRGRGKLAARGARRERAHERASPVDRIHAYAIAQQRAARLAPGRIYREHGDAKLVALVETKAAHELIGQRALARAARTGDAQYGGAALFRRLANRPPIEVAELEGGDHLRERAGIAGLELVRRVLREVEVAARQHVVDHALQAHALAVFRRVDARHAAVVQLLDLGRHDDAAAAAEHLDMSSAARAQQLDHVLEELDVPALIGRHGDALHVLLQRRGDDLIDRAVVPQMNYFGARGLQDAAHDVDRRVVAVEQARRRDEADLVLRLVNQLARVREVGHGAGRGLRDRNEPS